LLGMQPLCPSRAIYEAKPHFMIDANNAPNVERLWRPAVRRHLPLKSDPHEDGVPLNPRFAHRHPDAETGKPDNMATVVFTRSPLR